FWNIRKFPLTWSMILINVIIFMVFFVDARQNNSWYRFYTPTNMVLTGRIYHDYVQTLSAEQRLKIPHWVQTLEPKTDEHFYRLASWSLRDALFLDSVKYLPVQGDEVAI